MELKAPWLNFYDGISHNLSYPDVSISKIVENTAKKYPRNIALVYMGRKISYCEFTDNVLRVCRVLTDLGIKAEDKVLVCLPNIPQAVYLLYAADRLGAVCGFVHPLSGEAELARYIRELDAVCVVALDSMEDVFARVMSCTGDRLLILTNALDEGGSIYKLCKKVKTKGKTKYFVWNKLVGKTSESKLRAFPKKADDIAVILFSGGTTGEPKGVLLSGKGLNAMAMQTAHMSGCQVLGKSMLAAMPLFHGFGLCICIHAVLMHGGTCILVPKFNARGYALLIRKYSPRFIAGVPTLFESLLKEPAMYKLDLSCLEGVFSGGDALPEKLKEAFDSFLEDHKSKVKIREGYGLTECVTASCLMPKNRQRQGSVGIPFPDTYYKICREGTVEEVPYGIEGEICICGPALMKGYLNSKEETDKVLKLHGDGYVWLHTGDGGMMDADGFVYFKRRLRRMIVTGGYNVYPEYLERLLDCHPAVSRSCVVGVQDDYKMQKIKFYIVPEEGAAADENLRTEIMNYCKRNVARYSLPSEIEFRKELPLTKFGKIAYTQLENGCKS